MYYLIDILEKPFNMVYSFFIVLSLGIWLLSFLGISKSFSDHSHAINHSSDIHTDNFFGDLFNFGSVPITVWLTLLLFFVGTLGIVGNEFTLSLFSSSTQKIIASIGIFCVSTFLSFKIVSLASKPLGLLFKDYGLAIEANHLVGKIAKASSGKITSSFGQATIEIEGNNIDLAVRVAESSPEIEYGQMILITHFDEEKNIYWCEKY